MSQITWRNVGATASPSGVGDLMTGAHESITRGFDALGKVLEQRKATEAANWEQGKENNLNTIMNAAMAYEDPEALAASMQGGKFREMLEGYGAQVDQEKVRNFLDTRGGVLQERVLANQEFGDKQHNYGLQDEVMGALQGLAQGDRSGYNVLAQLRGQQGIDTLNSGQGLLKGNVDMRVSQQNADSSRISANASALNARTNRERSSREGQLHQRNLETLDNRMEAMGAFNNLAGQVLSGGLTDVDEIEAQVEQLRAAMYEQGKLAPTEIDALVNETYAGIKSGTGLSPLMEGALNMELDRERRELGGENNLFLQNPRSTNPAADVNEILDNFTDDQRKAWGFENPRTRAQAAEEAFRMSTTGFTVVDRSDSGERREVNVVMPPDFVKLMAHGIEGRHGLTGIVINRRQSFEENAKRFLEANPQLIEQMERANAVWKAEDELYNDYGQRLSPVGAALNFGWRPEY